MPVSPPSLTLPTLVTTLRAAGCVFAEDEAQLLVSAARNPDELALMVELRVAGHPLEHLLGWAEFCGLRIQVEAGVFVPRRRTEFLVHVAAALTHQAARTDPAAAAPDAPGTAAAPGGLAAGSHESIRRRRTNGSGTLTPARTVVVDMCCGSGAVGAALAAMLGGVDLYASDIDPAAVRCARRNLAPVDGRVVEGDLYEPLPSELLGRIDVLTANAPYVPSHAIGMLPPEARDHEPLTALDGGADGLDMQRRVAAAAPVWLAPGGCLLMETSERQAPRTAEVFAANGLDTEVLACAELDATVVIGTNPGP
ncbi:putative protein N(5)-glutamine methyltransferase [Streptomycetaceae bacterium NBC_01309]